MAWCVLLLTATPSLRAQTCAAVASNIDFGAVSPITGSAYTATGTVNITCTWPAVTLVPNAQVCLNLNAGTPRALVNGTNSLFYDLYTDNGRTLRWSSGASAIPVTLTKPLLGTTATASVTYYGLVAANQQTVPSVNNSNTVYTQSFAGALTSLGVGFYLTPAPTCASLIASSGTFPFSATATVINNCTITATNVAFATVSVLSSPLTATGSLNVSCTNGDAWRIALSAGGSANQLARVMQRGGGGGTVGYQLYTDAARTIVWGDATAGTAMASGTGTGTAQAVSIYGRVPAQSTPQPGTYSDSITATISF